MRALTSAQRARERETERQRKTGVNTTLHSGKSKKTQREKEG